MINFNIKLLLAVCLVVAIVGLASGDQIKDSETNLKNRRATYDEIELYFEKARDAQGKMVEADNHDDQEEYEKWQSLKDEYLRKWFEARDRFIQSRDYHDPRV